MNTREPPLPPPEPPDAPPPTLPQAADTTPPPATPVPPQAPAPQHPAPYYPSAYPAAPIPYRPTSGLAVVSLISGILSYVFLPLIGALVAILTGHLARAEVRRNANMEGAGLALGGLILGYLNLFLMVAVFLFSLLVFGSMGFFIRQIISTLVNEMN